MRPVARHEAGFTLVEVIFVIVILAIISSIGSGFVVTALDSYRAAQQRNQLLQRGRVTLEQMTRELRMALPNAVRVSSGGQCLEFLPVLAAANYHGLVADQINNQAEQTQIQTGSFSIQDASARHLVIAPFSPADVYMSGKPSARIGIASLGSGTYTAVSLSSSHRFIRNSPKKRLFIASDPVRFCITGGNLVRYSGYGFSTAALGTGNPGGTAALMAHEVAPVGTAFSLSPAAQDRGMLVRMQLRFSAAGTGIDLNHQALIRNVP
ncbi:MAG: prepilin-type N-terminal cleavage/methylation domain-containing protein [Cellvibrionaceae bacterium]|nr:prepilin-type N-terminal cleavage/methylation domain-containing protein [Cellvibrionaceae bacterium]